MYFFTKGIDMSLDWTTMKRWLKRVGNWVMNIYLVAFGLGVLWVVAHVLFVASFSTPTESMMPTIFPGDYVLVNKSVMGARLFDIFDALGGEQVKIRRGPALGRLRSGDVVVFNHPYTESWDSLAMDIRVYYMKRCVAVAGDTVELRDCHYVINGQPVEVGVAEKQREVAEFLDRHADEPEVISRSIVVKAFPNDPAVDWTIRDMGPLIVPRKGTVIELDTLSAIVYRNYIEWETGSMLTNDSTGIRLDGKVVDRYEFGKDYCFVAGDNAFNSQDSRYFGLVPMEYVVGTASVIWQSVDPVTGKRRWERTGKKI